MRKFHRFFLYGLITTLVLIVVSAAALLWVFFGTIPSYGGHAQIAGLSDDVHVYRDEHGVPHIFAKDMNDAARALGYVHASERMFQMEMQRRTGQGRLSEVIGPSMLGVDKFIRTLGLYPLAQSSYQALSPEAQAFFSAYADGVNGWLNAHRTFGLSADFLILGISPEPWKPADSLVWGKLMAYQLSHNYKLEALRGALAKKLTPGQMRDLFPPYGDAPVTAQKNQSADISGGHFSINGPAAPSDMLGRLTTLDHGASNEWTVSGAWTESGKPLLANDPHLSLGIPILWYLARIVTPQLSIKGATVPGLPVMLLGQNNAIAWGMTTTGSDVEDLFIETLDPQNAHNYMAPGGSKPFDVRVETIHVKGLKDVTLLVRSTRHGPVLSDIDPELESLGGAGKVVALSFTGLGAADTSAEALMRINRVVNWHDFLSALKLYQAPPQNVVYADVKGDIGFINPGLLPVRKKGEGLVPADGASGAYDWTGNVPFDQLPQLYNPPTGVIFNANNALSASGTKPFLGLDWDEPYRAERLQSFFNKHEKQTLDTAAMMQADDVSLAARQLLPYLLRQETDHPRLQSAIELLRKWDGTMDKNRPEPLIFDAWLYQMHRLLLSDGSGNLLEEKGPYAASSINYILAHDSLVWCKDKNCNAIVLKALDAAISWLSEHDGNDVSSWRWGNEHKVLLTNNVFTHVPFLRDVSDLSIPSNGDFYTLDRGGSFDAPAEHPFQREHGAGYRGLYDLGDPERSRFMIATGESGHLLSPHYKDLVPLWNDVQSFTLTGTEAQLAKRGLPELVLTR